MVNEATRLMKEQGRESDGDEPGDRPFNWRNLETYSREVMAIHRDSAGVAVGEF